MHIVVVLLSSAIFTHYNMLHLMYITVELQGQYSTMLEDLRLTLAKQEETIRTQKEEIRQLKELLQEKVDQLAEKVGECKKVSVELTTAKKQQAQQQASMSREVGRAALSVSVCLLCSVVFIKYLCC